MGAGRVSLLLALVGRLGLGAIAAPTMAQPPVPAVVQTAATEEIDRAIAAGTQLFQEGSVESLRKAIAQFEQALGLARSAKAQDKQALSLLLLGRLHDDLGEKQKALDYYHQAVPIFRMVGDRQSESIPLNNIGLIYDDLGEKQKALDYYHQSLLLKRAVGDSSGEATMLNNIGLIYSAIGEKQKALDYYNQALPLFRAVGNRSGESSTLNKIGLVYSAIGEKQKALDYYHQALGLMRAVGDSPEERLPQRGGEANILNNIGALYSAIGEKQKALDYYNQALPLYRALGDRDGEAITLNNIGTAYNDLGEKQQALDYYNQALPLRRAAGDSPEVRLGQRNGEATTLNNIGRVYDDLGKKQKALDYYNQALPLMRAVDNRSGEAAILNNIGGAYNNLGEKQKALDYYNQALSIRRVVGERHGEANALNNIGLVYDDLGEKQKALDYYNQALPLRRAVGDRGGEAATLNNIGGVYSDLDDKQKAVEYYNQALPLYRTVGDRSGEASTLNNIGLVYDDLGEKQKALDYYNQALPLRRAVGDRSGEAITLHNMGAVYSALDEKQNALEYYNQALPLYRTVGKRDGEATTLNNLGLLFASQKQPESAIAFLKQSVNLYESLRKEIKTLPRETQETYAKSISGTYRGLADTLLTQGRIGEAQQVLELLKIQDAQTYTRSPQSGAEMTLNQSEQAILTTHKTLIAFGQDLRTCKSDPSCQNSPKLTTLLTQRDQQNQAFETLLKTLEADIQQRIEKDTAFIDPNNPNYDLRRRAQELLAAQPGSVLIYPLVLESKMWLLVASEGPILTRYEVPVSQTELATTIIAFRKEMKRCETQSCTQADHARAKALSQKLYGWMFPPDLQKAIKTAPKPITNLIFAPDRATRYIPMGALHDGQKYLIETYSLSTIVAASKTEATARLPQSPKVLGLGLSQAVPGFNPLPSVIPEVNAIVRSAPGAPTPPPDGIFPGKKFLNSAFTQNTLQTQLPGHHILHLATHGKFVPGDINKSFLLLGNGDKLPIQAIDSLDDLSNIHLVVLSACETGLGDRREQDGIEIAGISNTFLQRGAKAVIASLWQVSDPATGAYMQRFYHYLAKPNTSKVQAMQTVSRDFIDGKVTISELNIFRAGAKPLSGSQSKGPMDLSHPYYWAPFILIGNGL